MKIELRELSAVRPYDRNPRKNDQAVAAVVKSIREFGFRQPIVVDAAGVIVCGHTRYKAAVEMGLAQVPVHVAVDLTPAQIQAYRIADNKSNELAEWDFDLLPIELADLQGMDFNLDLLGFDAKELDRILNHGGNAGLADPDDVPAPPDEATTKPGDLWILGEHRLLCGDSSNPAHLDRLLGGRRIQLVNTDPPYGVAVEPRSNAAIAAGLSSFAAEGDAAPQRKLRAKDRPLANDQAKGQAYDDLLDAWFGNAARALEPGRACYFWGGYGNCENYLRAFRKAGLYFSQSLIWVKEHPVMNRKDFMGNHEWCFYGWREGAAHRYFGPNNAVDVWSVKKLHHASMVHLTEKPVELASRAMQYSSEPGEHVLDLFGGSGSTLIAAEQTGRRAFLMELDALYADVIVNRWEQFTGRKADLESASVN